MPPCLGSEGSGREMSGSPACPGVPLTWDWLPQSILRPTSSNCTRGAETALVFH